MSVTPEEIGPARVVAPAVPIGFAGPWRRLGGWVIDWVIVNVLAIVPTGLLAASADVRSSLVGGLVVLGIWPVYSILLIHLRGQTLGRMALRIKVVDLEDGRPPGWGRSTIRVLVQLGLLLALFVPVLAALNYARVLWDPWKRGWHDRAARTIVVGTFVPRTIAEADVADALARIPWAPPPTAPLSRWRRAGIAALTIVGVVGLAGLFYVGLYDYLEDDLVNADFRNGAEPFEVGADDLGTYDLVDGTYRVTPKERGSWALTLGELRRRAYALGVQADLVEVSQPGIAVGVGCVGPSPDGEGLVGYLFTVAPGGDFTLRRNGFSVAKGVDPRIHTVRRLGIMCVPDLDGSVFVIGLADGLEVVRYDDPRGLAEYTYALLGVMGEPGSQVRFTRVWARVPDERWATDAPPGGAIDDDGASEPSDAPSDGSIGGGDDAVEPGTFAAHGVSFEIPAGWTVDELRIPGTIGWSAAWAVVAHQPLHYQEEVRVIAWSTGGALAGEVAKARLDIYAQKLGAVKGPTPSSVGGLPAFEGRVVGYARLGRDLERRVVVVVRGTAAYEISCEYEPSSAEAIARCDQVIGSFELSV